MFLSRTSEGGSFILRNTKRLNIVLTPYLYDKLVQVSDMEETTLNEVIRSALRHYFKEKGVIKDLCLK